MSENCFHSNPLRRDGTSRQQRTLHTLLPSYVAVDERSMKELWEFVQLFAEEIKFYDKENSSWNPVLLEHNTWENFFEIPTDDWASFSLEEYLTWLKIDQATNPHHALFFGFLYMFKVVQEDINTLTQRHLEFYYKEVLQLKEKVAEPDKVSVIFELAKHMESHLLKAGTPLKAGKDNTGANITYTLNEDAVINMAQVAAIKAQFANLSDTWAGQVDYPKTDHRIYISPEANSADGLGEKLETEEKDWRVFGRPSFVVNPDDPPGLRIADRQEGKIGFAIASPTLFLAEGQRKISLEIGIDPNGPDLDFTKISIDHFSMLLSGEEEWVIAEVINCKETAPKSGKLLIEGRLAVDLPAVVAYDDEVFAENIRTKWPVLKLFINTDNPQVDSIYRALTVILSDSITVTVEIEGEVEDVPGIQNLIVQNDNGILDASKPMQIFGNQPRLGSKFYIGSWEMFQKPLDHITIKHQWIDLPADAKGFADYYNNYSPANGRNNRSFRINTSVLDQKEWKDVFGWRYLFRDNDGNPVADDSQLPSPIERSKMHLVSSTLPDIERDADLQPFEEYDNSLEKGFIRYELDGIDFGHKTFPKDFSDQAILLSKESPPADAELPNAPYLPIIESLSIYYKSSIDMEVINTGSDRVDQFFHLEPFGNYEVDTTKGSNTLFPSITEEGTLFLGVENLNAPQTLSLLIQVAEGSANPEKEIQKVQWSYLSEENWIPFDQYNLLADGTNGLLTSGIVKFDIPRDISTGNSRLSPDLYWLKATVEEHSDAVCNCIDIRTQAISASFHDNENDPKFLENALPAGTISKLLNADAAIKKLEQPYASSDGKPPEKEKAFYTRVSERLRHKNRAITIWDYEHLILEKFPKVYKVKCVNHTLFDGTITNYSESAPGHVSLVIIANVLNKNAVDPLRPLASLDQLSQITSFITEINPPCAILHVKNPIYEEVKVDFQVKFHVGIDVGYHISKLQEEIKFFLSPWASDCATDIVFGGRIHKSVLLNFVEERSYVDYVTCFKMYHIVAEDPNNNPNQDVDEAIALTSVSIIGSADGHTITEIAASATDQCQCDDNVIKSTKELTVIDNC